MCLLGGSGSSFGGDCGSVERLLVDPHQRSRLVRFALVLDAVELVAELTVLPLVVVVIFGLPDGFKCPGLLELDKETERERVKKRESERERGRLWLSF